MILVIDNYDSFTYNLVQYMGEVTQDSRPFEVHRNDRISLDQIAEMNPRHIVISPGPCTPNEAGISIALSREFSGKIPILGVCLGHQAIAQAFGARIVRAQFVRHGKTSWIEHNGRGIFAGIEQRFVATRYHSLVVEQSPLPACLVPTAYSAGQPHNPSSPVDREIMAFEHREHPSTIGLQFHPESILTKVGRSLLFAFLQMKCAAEHQAPDVSSEGEVYSEGSVLRVRGG